MGYEAWGAKPLEEHALASATGSKNAGEGSFIELREKQYLGESSDGILKGCRHRK
jgi:hypothetical protein